MGCQRLIQALMDELPSRILVVTVTSVADSQPAGTLACRLEYLFCLGEFLSCPVNRENAVILALDYTQMTPRDKSCDITHVPKVQHSREIVAFAMADSAYALLVGREGSGRDAD